MPPMNFIPLKTLSPTFSAAWPTSACVMLVILPSPNSDDDRLEAAFDGMEPAEEEERRREALLLVEVGSNDGDEVGEGDVNARR